MEFIYVICAHWFSKPTAAWVEFVSFYFYRDMTGTNPIENMYYFVMALNRFKKKKVHMCHTHTRWYHFGIDVPGQHVIRLNIRLRQLDSTN